MATPADTFRSVTNAARCFRKSDTQPPPNWSTVQVMDLGELVEQIRRSNASLFYGAGLSVACGGPTWDELFSAIKNRFPEGKSTSYFEYVQEIIGYDDSNRAEIEDLIRSRLAHISPKEEQRYLFSLPWKSVLTTNYDHLPESLGTTLDESRQIVSISEQETQIDQTKSDYLYCFKLLGDSKFSYPKGGWMMLSTSDLFAASERRSGFFRKFRNLATSGHLVYLGCSFKDDLVFNILYQMKTVLQVLPWKGFALMRSEPEAETRRKLDQIGIAVIQGTIEDFISATKKVFGNTPTSSQISLNSTTLHKQVVEVDRSTLSNIWRKFRVLNDQDMSTSEKALDFLGGTSSSFFPYVMNWDVERNAKAVWLQRENKAPHDFSSLKNKAGSIQLSDNVFVALIGIAGSGKTIMVNRLAFDWFQSGNPVIFVNSENLAIDTDALNGLMNDLRDKYIQSTEKSGIKNPKPFRWLVIADECQSLLPELRMLENYLLSSGRPADLVLVSRESETPIDRLKNAGVDAIYRIDDTVDPAQRDKLFTHLRRFGIDDESLISYNIQDPEINSSFFALMYSLIRHSRLTLKRLLQQEYSKLDEDSQRAYRIVSLIQSYRLQPLLSLILNSQGFNQDWLDHEVKRGRLSGVLRLADYGKSIVTVNRVVAEAIADNVYRTSEERKAALKGIISRVTFGDYAEMQLLDNLLSHRIELGVGPRLEISDKISLFQEGIEIVPSRPLLIHLGRILTNAQRFSDATKILRDAHEAHVEGFDELPEHVLDAEGRLEHARAEANISEGNPEEAWEHLALAQSKFTDAQIDPITTPHPYEGLARVHLTQARISDDKGIKWQFLLAAMEEANYVENHLGETGEVTLLKLEIENQLSHLGFDERHIDEIAEKIGRANGCAYLAEHEISQGRHKVALELVEKGRKEEPFSVWLMRLRVALLRRLYPDDHSAISETLEDYASVSDEKYDVSLSFERAKEEYMSGRVREARIMFRALSSKASHYPWRLIPRDPEDRWIEHGKPKRVTGTIREIPIAERYGYVETTFPTSLKDSLVISRRNLEFRDPRLGDRVSYEIMFNMLGAQARAVRKI